MKKLLAASLLTLGLSISAFAVQTTPLTTKVWNSIPNTGASSTCMIDSSTGTAAVLCTSGNGVILDVSPLVSRQLTTIIIRDSATANTSSNPLIILDKNSLDKQVHVFPRFNNGLTVNAGVAPGGHWVTPCGLAGPSSTRKTLNRRIIWL
jgi:hypothetical protein